MPPARRQLPLRQRHAPLPPAPGEPRAREPRADAGGPRRAGAPGVGGDRREGDPGGPGPFLPRPQVPGDGPQAPVSARSLVFQFGLLLLFRALPRGAADRATRRRGAQGETRGLRPAVSGSGRLVVGLPHVVVSRAVRHGPGAHDFDEDPMIIALLLALQAELDLFPAKDLKGWTRVPIKPLADKAVWTVGADGKTLVV